MRISDWSSDVCSSDLLPVEADLPGRGIGAYAILACCCQARGTVNAFRVGCDCLGCAAYRSASIYLVPRVAETGIYLEAAPQIICQIGKDRLAFLFIKTIGEGREWHAGHCGNRDNATIRSDGLALQIEAAQQPRESPVKQRAVKLDFVTILLYFRNERGIDQLERAALPSGHASVAGQAAHAVEIGSASRRERGWQ